VLLVDSCHSVVATAGAFVCGHSDSRDSMRIAVLEIMRYAGESMHGMPTTGRPRELRWMSTMIDSEMICVESMYGYVRLLLNCQIFCHCILACNFGGKAGSQP
jgi:hypothetical protein